MKNGMIVNEYGSKEWWLNGKRHREDGPAYESIDGGKSWYSFGELHREDGPAIEASNGEKLWFLNGKIYSEKEFNAIQIIKLANKLDLELTSEYQESKKLKI